MTGEPETEDHRRPGAVLLAVLVITTLVIWLGALSAGLPRPVAVVIGATLLCVDLLALVMVMYSTRQRS